MKVTMTFLFALTTFELSFRDHVQVPKVIVKTEIESAKKKLNWQENLRSKLACQKNCQGNN